MARNIEYVVDASHDPEVAVFVLTRAIAGEVAARNLREVGLLEAFRIAVDGAQHRRPWFLDHQKSARSWRHGDSVFVYHIGCDSRQRTSGRSRLSRRCSR